VPRSEAQLGIGSLRDECPCTARVRNPQSPYPTLLLAVMTDAERLTGSLEVSYAGGEPRIVAGLSVNGKEVFEFLLGTTSFSECVHLDIAMRTTSGSRLALGRVVGRLDRVPARAAVVPVQLVGVGRSGTTLLMGLLGRHPEIVVASPFPYEIRASRYWTHLLQRLLEPSAPLWSAHPSTFWRNAWWVGLNPFFDGDHAEFFESEYGEYVARLSLESINFLLRARI
jgi:hypothetical protein